MANSFTTKPVGWVKPLITEFENTACWVSQSSTQSAMVGKAADPTLEINGRHAGPGSGSGVTDPASRFLDPGLRRDDGLGKCQIPSTIRSQKGLTLVEVLVAVAILAIGLLAIGSMQKTATMVNMRAYDITEAADLAQSRLEFLMSMPYSDDLTTRCGDETPCEDIEPFASIEEEQRQWIGGYNCQCATALASGQAAGAKMITVTVSAQEGGSTTPDYAITGVKAQTP